MIYQPSEKARHLIEVMTSFLTDHVFPAEVEYEEYRRQAGDNDHSLPPVVERLKKTAQGLGLWNLFLPAWSGISQLDYSFIAELSGWSVDLAPEAINCQAPDTGNMELLHLFANEEQRRGWLEPLSAGTIRSAFAMTEPAVASSDATSIETLIERDGDEYVISGRKWWISGAADERCQLLIVMGKTDPSAPIHRQQSMVLVPRNTPGVTIVRDLPIYGHHDQHGHCEVHFDRVRVPISALLGDEGSGFALAQARLGPGRIHHCMRALGAGERALAMMVDRASSRVAFGSPLSDQGVIQQAIAESRIALDSARLLCQRAAAALDEQGNKVAAPLVSQAKTAVPRTVGEIIDRAIQIFGAAGVSDDVPLARMWGWHRAMRIFDGPDEVHLRSIARAEISAPPRPLYAALRGRL